MHLVTQLTPFTCGLACVESVCIDFKIQKRQEDFLREFKGELIHDIPKIEIFGATTLNLLAYILQRYGFKTQMVKDHRPEVQQEIFEKVDMNQTAIIIYAHFELNSHHFIRFAGMDQNDTIFGMNPTFNGALLDKYSISNLIKWDYSFVLIQKGP